MSTVSQTILLVEDSEDDVFFMRRALKKAQISCPLEVACDGQQAIDYLGRTGKYAGRAEHPLPSLVFLDLKMPCVSGFEVLEWLRQQPPALNEIPVFVLTSSPEERDRNR